jgi:hypothetical protein
MRYLYIFGYETPGEAERNRRLGCDDESSCALVIEASSPDEALDWGRQVAEEFYRRLYRDDQTSWARARFADQVSLHDGVDVSGIEVVPVGVHPDYSRLLAGIA